MNRILEAEDKALDKEIAGINLASCAIGQSHDFLVKTPVIHGVA